MVKLINYKQEIMQGNPDQQVIEVSLHPNSWERFFGSYPIIQKVFQGLTMQHGRYIITRNDVRNATGQHRIIKALLWAFADSPRVHNMERILPELGNIVTLLKQHQDDDLHATEFKAFYNALLRIPGVGVTTASILLFFYNVRCEGCAPVAITNLIACEFARFDELHGVENLHYFEQLYRFNAIATNIDVTSEQIEYFLYRVSRGEIQI